MNEIKNLKTKQINDFMASFDDLRNINTDQIEEGLRDILGEKPGIEFEYGVDFELNEDTGDKDRKDGLKKIHVIYTYIEDVSYSVKVGRISYIVG